MRAGGAEEGCAQGKIEGEIEALGLAIHQVLESRGSQHDEVVSEAIAGAADRDLLTLWLRRAAVWTDSRSPLDPS